MNNFIKGITKENPVFVLYLGLCSALAITTSINNALGMGVCVILVLICSEIIISALRKIIPNEIRIPVYIVIIAALVKCCGLLLQAYIPSIYSAMGVYIDLIVVNCIVLGRCEAFASKNGIGASIMDGLSMGLGYTFALLVVSIIRQILSTGMLVLDNPMTGANIFSITLIPADFTISMFGTPTGAFLTFALIAAGFAAMNARSAKKEGK